jgi:hypothetical protein
MAETPKIVPFGKYKGQPVDVLAQDTAYCEWLSQQDWFRSRYTAIHTLIINHFAAPAETPEHNALQALFTDDAWIARFLRDKLLALTADLKQFLHKEADRARDVGFQRWLPTAEVRADWRVEFEQAGVDVTVTGRTTLIGPPREDLNAGWLQEFQTSDGFQYRIECKPSLGDDYPAVLRQMRATNSNVLFLGADGYQGQGASLSQVQQIFQSAHIEIIRLADVPSA